MALLLLAMPGNEEMTRKLAELLPAEIGTLFVRSFPDRESYLRLDSDVQGRDIALVCTLNQPNTKLPPLLFAGDLVRELGARSIGLIAPYLAYMRQDTRFARGEAITSRSFARMVSASFDWLVTVDPHLHRYTSLDEVYTIPSAVAHAGPVLGEWIRGNVHHPLVVGPDAESAQWVRDVAERAGAPHVTFTKRRLGDRSVVMEAPDLSRFRGMQPVLVDDIASSGGTLVEAANHLVGAGSAKPVCLIVHALLAKGALKALGSETAKVISTDTIPHPTNQLSIAPALAGTIRELRLGSGSCAGSGASWYASA